MNMVPEFEKFKTIMFLSAAWDTLIFLFVSQLHVGWKVELSYIGGKEVKCFLLNGETIYESSPK